MSTPAPLDINRAKAEILDEVLSKFFNEANYFNVDQYEIEQEKKGRYKALSLLYNDNTLDRNGEAGSLAFSSVAYFRSNWWKRDIEMVNKLRPLLLEFYRKEPNGQHAVSDLLAAAKTKGIHNISSIGIDRLLKELRWAGWIGGYMPRDGLVRRLESFQVSRAILESKKIEEAVEGFMKPSNNQTIPLFPAIPLGQPEQSSQAKGSWFNHPWVVNVGAGLIVAFTIFVISRFWAALHRTANSSPTIYNQKQEGPSIVQKIRVRNAHAGNAQAAPINQGPIHQQTNIGQQNNYYQPVSSNVTSSEAAKRKVQLSIDRAIEDANNVGLPDAQRSFQKEFDNGLSDASKRGVLFSSSTGWLLRTAAQNGKAQVDEACRKTKRIIEDALLELGVSVTDMPATSWLSKQATDFNSLQSRCTSQKSDMDSAVRDQLKRLNIP